MSSRYAAWIRIGGTVDRVNTEPLLNAVREAWAKRDWNADWTAGTARRDDGYAIGFAIPFKALGATPGPGDVWRINVVANTHAGRTEPQTSAWSSSQDPCHKTECFGTLVFE